MAANPSSPPGPGYVWISDGSSGSNGTDGGGYWMAPGDPNAAANYTAGGAAASWKLPMAPGPSYFESGTGNPWVTPGLQRSMNQFFSTPTSGYGEYMAPGGADYGAQLGRWQYSTSAPVPKTAPQGWGRYPGMGGGLPSAPLVTNPTQGGLPPQQGQSGPLPYQLKSNYTLPTNSGTTGQTGGAPGFKPPETITPPQTAVPQQGTTPPSTQGWMPGPATSQVPSNTLSGFTFQNAAPGSVQANFNAIQAKYGPNDAINYLIRNGYTNGAWSQFTNALKAGGMGQEDISRITNQFSAGGSGGIFNNSLEGFNGGVYSNGQDVTGLLASLGIKDTSAADALAAYKAQQKARLGR